MLKLYNTFSRKLETFKPLEKNKVKMYSCGPTVYNFAHIGNFRTYILSDIVHRALKYFGYQVKLVMNITDVGHLTSDADEGEDKLEKGAKREGKTAWDIAEKYTKIFLEDTKKLNILPSTVLCKATDHIKEQIDLVKQLEQKGLTYRTSDGIYFNTSKFKDYNKLAKLDVKGLKEGARVAKNPEKKNPTDFALWKFSPKGKKRDMEWDSPWGKGFPGWHIECSAMSMKYLGNTLDLHLGGVDLIPVHHTNEIAQAEAATDKKFVNYWLHGEFILVNNEKMSKSKGNFYSLKNIEDKGFDLLSLRYLYLNTHYRTQMNFTWDALKGAETALRKLREVVKKGKLNNKSEKLTEKFAKWQDSFKKAVSNDLNMPEALAVVWQAVKAKELNDQEKAKLLLDFDRVLGLKLDQKAGEAVLPKSIEELKERRFRLRQAGQWQEADKVRQEIEDKGYKIEDTEKGTLIKKRAAV